MACPALFLPTRPSHCVSSVCCSATAAPAHQAWSADSWAHFTAPLQGIVSAWTPSASSAVQRQEGLARQPPHSCAGGLCGSALQRWAPRSLGRGACCWWCSSGVVPALRSLGSCTVCAAAGSACAAAAPSWSRGQCGRHPAALAIGDALKGTCWACNQTSGNSQQRRLCMKHCAHKRAMLLTSAVSDSSVHAKLQHSVQQLCYGSRRTPRTLKAPSVAGRASSGILCDGQPAARGLCGAHARTAGLPRG